MSFDAHLPKTDELIGSFQSPVIVSISKQFLMINLRHNSVYSILGMNHEHRIVDKAKYKVPCNRSSVTLAQILGIDQDPWRMRCGTEHSNFRIFYTIIIRENLLCEEIIPNLVVKLFNLLLEAPELLYSIRLSVRSHIYIEDVWVRGNELVYEARPLRRPRWPQVWQTDRQTDRHDKGALGLLVTN